MKSMVVVSVLMCFVVNNCDGRMRYYRTVENFADKERCEEARVVYQRHAEKNETYECTDGVLR